MELLKADPSLAAGAAPAKRTTVRALPAPVALDADDQALLRQTIDYYHQRLKETPGALAYLAARGLEHPALVDICISNENTGEYSTEEGGQPQQFTYEQFRAALKHWREFRN